MTANKVKEEMKMPEFVTVARRIASEALPISVKEFRGGAEISALGSQRIQIKTRQVPGHASDLILASGPGSVHICADTSVVGDTIKIRAYLEGFGMALRKQTTNPTLLNKYITQGGGAAVILDELRKQEAVPEGMDFKEAMLALGEGEFAFRAAGIVYRSLLDQLAGAPLSAEVDYVHGTTIADEIIAQGKRISSIDPQRIVIKVPVTDTGIAAIRILEEDGIRTNATLVFTLEQALAAADAGATFVSPFAGRVTAYMSSLAEKNGIGSSPDDKNYDMRFAQDGMDFVASVVHAFAREGQSSMIIPASIRPDKDGLELDHLRRIWEMSRFATVPLVPTIPTAVLMAPESLQWLLKFHESTVRHDGTGLGGHPLCQAGLGSFANDANAWVKSLLGAVGDLPE